METTYELIETQEALLNILPIIAAEDRIGVDLEADSMFHFREKVCLVQLAAGDRNFVIDPLQVPDLSPLRPIFSDPEIRKIFHGADYDVRSLFRDFGIVVDNLFDTELATRFLGYRSSGLDAVLRERFGVCLDKKYQKKDWSRRPLSEGMIAYAAGDTRYLIPLSKILEEELAEKSRLDWVAEECWLLQQVRHPDTEERPLFLRFKGAGRLDRRSLAVLEGLLEFRLHAAEKKDKPLFKVLGNDVLLKLSQLRPASLKALKQSRTLSPRQLSMYGNSLVERIRTGLEIADRDLPVYPRRKAPRMKPIVPVRIKAMKEWRDGVAERLEMDPALLLNKALLTAIAVRNPSVPEELGQVGEMKNWQRREFGSHLVATLKEVRG